MKWGGGKLEIADYVQTVCELVAEADRRAVVLASPPSWRPDGHVTIIHDLGRDQVIDAAIKPTKLATERLDERRVRVYAPKPKRVRR